MLEEHATTRAAPPPPAARRASRCWLGTVTFGAWGRTTRADCVEIVHAALDHGVTAFDTAESYGDGEAEELLGVALRGRRDEAFVCSKFGFEARTSTPVPPTAAGVRASLEATLRRLRTDHLDLYLLHRVAPALDLEDVLGVLDILVREGKILAYGTSMATAPALEQLHAFATGRSCEVSRWEQPPYSIFVREAERTVLPACARLGIRVATFAPLNGGWLTGKYRLGEPPPAGSRATTWSIRPDRYDFRRTQVRRKLELVPRLEALARGAGLSLPQLSVAFTISNPAVAATIIGARSVQQLVALTSPHPEPLPVEVLERIDEIVPPGQTLDPLDVAGYAPAGR